MSKKVWLWTGAAIVAGVLAMVAVLVCLRQGARPEPEPSVPVVATTTTTTMATTKVTATTMTAQPPTTTTTQRGRVLEITSHKRSDITITEPFTVFAGTSDPDQPLLLNGEPVERAPSGAFSVDRTLQPGKNTFTFSHKGKTVTYTVRYRYVVMKSYSPSDARRYKSGASFSVVVTAREGSTVTATFRGKTITLKRATTQVEEDTATSSDTFVRYTGSFALPEDNTKDLDLGKVTFKAVCNGVTATGTSGKIVCEKAELPTVGEIVTYSAETFDGDKADDASRTTNNYFPEGTVDYVVGRSYFENKEYLNLRCGRRVYVKTSQGVLVSKEYVGKLPETNRLKLAALEVSDRATTLTLDTDWKAPFFLDLLPQKYTDPSEQDYTVSKVTCEYVEITFCYASALTGEIAFPENHPLFARATVTKAKKNTVLRLYLRRTGGFYGWDASYNEAGQLVFWFLHPVQVAESDNAYGADLTGATVLLDVGHGGGATGAYGPDNRHPEKERNLYLAQLLREELERMGATVVLNRTDDTPLDNDERCQQLKALKPDLCVAIHHDGNESSRPNGFGSFHFSLYAREAARYIYEETMAAGIYDASAANNRNRFEWHYYFVGRMSDCPVVLTENGFMTNQLDYAGIVSAKVNRQKAQAIAAGVARYFLSIRLPDTGSAGTTTTPSTESTTATESTTTTTENDSTEGTTTGTAALPPEENA